MTKLVILHFLAILITLTYISAQHLAKHTVVLEISCPLLAPLVSSPSVRMAVLSVLPVYTGVQSVLLSDICGTEEV